MSPATRSITLEHANARIAELAAGGLKVYDLRHVPDAQQPAVIERLRADIKALMKRKGLDENHPLTLVTGSGKTEDPAVLAEAREMGKTLEAVVTGGSQYSVMGAVADGAKVKIGVTCEAIMPFEMPDGRYDILVITNGRNIYEGLEHRLNLARALAPKEVAIHGGMGTMEEILGGIKKRGRLSLLGSYWAPLIETFKRMYAEGYIAASGLDRVHVVDPAGSPVDALSHSVTPNRNADSFRMETSRIAGSLQTALKQRGMSAVVLDGKTPVEQTIPSHGAFILPPGNIDAMLQAMLISIDKRLDIMDKGQQSYPGIKHKPLIVLNIDGFYDGFMQKWREMEQQGYLMEKLSELNIVEVKVPAIASEHGIKSALSSAMPDFSTQVRPDVGGFSSRFASGRRTDIQAGL